MFKTNIKYFKCAKFPLSVIFPEWKRKTFDLLLVLPLRVFSRRLESVHSSRIMGFVLSSIPSSLCTLLLRFIKRWLVSAALPILSSSLVKFCVYFLHVYTLPCNAWNCTANLLVVGNAPVSSRTARRFTSDFSAVRNVPEMFIDF